MKTYLTLLIGLLLSIPTLSLAKTKKTDRNPKIPVFRTSVSADSSSGRKAKLYCIQALNEKLGTLEQEMAKQDFSALIQGDLQYSCRQIEVDLEGSSNRYSDGGYSDELGAVAFMTIGIFGHSHRTEKNVAITVYCVPRSMSEKQIYSFARRCEENPTPECFQKDMLAMMDTLAPASFVYNGVDKACN